MNREELDAVLKTHRMWLEGRKGEKSANLRDADLHGADLQCANLQCADLQCANLQCANLQCANLQRANLQRANLREADLHGADLHGADLRWANLREADLHGADLDFASWPLWCGTKGVRVDVRIFRQLAMHLCSVVVDDDECRAAQEALMPLARQCHRADEFLGEAGK